jgi:hypothetical protein
MTDDAPDTAGDDGPSSETPDDAVRGQFVVTHADPDSAVLKAVDGGQVHTLATNPDLDEDDLVEATLAPEPPMEVTWRVVSASSGAPSPRPSWRTTSLPTSRWAR